jgi:hypothetical protein
MCKGVLRHKQSATSHLADCRRQLPKIVSLLVLQLVRLVCFVWISCELFSFSSSSQELAFREAGTASC